MIEVTGINDSNGNSLWVKEDPYTFLRFRNISSASASFTCTRYGSPSSRTISVSTDGGSNWTSKTMTGNWSVTVASGSYLYMRGTNTSGFSTNNSNYYIFSMNQDFSVEGNLMCIINYSNPASVKTIADYCFYGLFSGSSKLKDISGLNFGYAETIGKWSFDSAFENCSGMTSVMSETLPFKTLKDRSLQSMFEGCTNITEGINLTNVTSAVNTYPLNTMYKNCSKLKNVYAPTVSWNAAIASNWLSGVAGSGTVYCKSTSYNSITSGVSGVPSGWTKTLIS